VTEETQPANLHTQPPFQEAHKSKVKMKNGKMRERKGGE
jgi:hypothetical protein